MRSVSFARLLSVSSRSALAPPPGVGFRDETLCNLDQIRYLEDTNYVRLADSPDIASPSPRAALTTQIDVSAGSGMTISMYETIEQVATMPNGHAYLPGSFRGSRWPFSSERENGSQGAGAPRRAGVGLAGGHSSSRMTC